MELLFLIECDIPDATLLQAFTDGPTYYPIPCNDRFKVLARFDPRFMPRREVPVPDNRFDIWQLMLPMQQAVLLTVVHGLDKRNSSESAQELFLQQVVAALSYCENEVGHTRSVILGDFNANPFEAPVGSAIGLNAVISRDVAQDGHRRIRTVRYPYFYNPMWNLLGDEPRGSAPATFYYRGSDPHELYWHMLDQVVIRPSLIDRFDVSALEIVNSIRGIPLTSMGGIPDRTRFSDHLPVVFDLDLSVEERVDEYA